MFNQRITADLTQLEQQARAQARDYFDNAYGHLERTRGKAYADENPAVIAAMIAAASNEMVWALAALKMQELTDVLEYIGSQLNEPV